MPEIAPKLLPSPCVAELFSSDTSLKWVIKKLPIPVFPTGRGPARLESGASSTASGFSYLLSNWTAGCWPAFSARSPGYWIGRSRSTLSRWLQGRAGVVWICGADCRSFANHWLINANRDHPCSAKLRGIRFQAVGGVRRGNRDRRISIGARGALGGRPAFRTPRNPHPSG
jgi:hypothetical protein